VFARAQSVKLRPDRLREIFGRVLVTTGRTRRGANRRRESFDQIIPGVLIATLARDDQTEIVSLQLVDELRDLGFGDLRIVPQQVLIDRRRNPWRQMLPSERTVVARARQQTLRAVVQDLLDLTATRLHGTLILSFSTAV